MFRSLKQLVAALFFTGAGMVVPALGISQSAIAATISFQASDFTTVNPTFNNVLNFDFTIELADPLAPGTVYNNPTLTSVDYSVNGTLPEGSPSGFAAFALVQSLSGSDFYDFGGSLSFEIAATADLSDGLQVSELVGTGDVFTFDARQDQGRYHPPIVVLRSDGTGLIQNSNNFGGINPSTNMLVDVDFGEEYITALTFTPSSLTIVPPVPLPAALPLLLSALGFFGFLGWRRKRTAAA